MANNTPVLKNCIKLSGSIAIHVSESESNQVLAVMGQLFNGATSTKAFECWVSPTGQEFTKKTTVVMSYSPNTVIQQNLDKIVDLCSTLKSQSGAEYIPVEINGELNLL